MTSMTAGATEDVVLARTFKLLRGVKLLKRRPANRVEIHASLVRGIPNTALSHLTASLALVPQEAVAGVVGVSTRTLRRSRDDPKRLMAPDLASRTWLLAEALPRAAEELNADLQRRRPGIPR